MDGQKFLYQSDTPSKTIYDRAITYLNEKYRIRFNEIALELEIQLKFHPEDWTALNINSLLIELAQSGIEISMNKLEVLVRSHLIPKYNPIQEYFERLQKWDGQDYIKKLAAYVKTSDDEAFSYHFEKWLTRTVLCSLKKGYVNKQCLVLAAHQNSGKTSYLRFLIPSKLENYYTENISIDKDGIIAICKNLLCNMDELAVLSKSDVNTLKSFVSKSSANVRLPYARKAENLERTCSFVGSTNRTDFLSDETGSVRWLVFEVFQIDFSYSNEIDINKVWAQAYYNAFERKNYNAELTATDIAENEKRNEKYAQISMEQELISAHFEKSEKIEEFLTATDIMLVINNALGLRLNNIKIGKALTSLKYQRIKHSKLQVYGYLIKRKIE
ncbi:VapE domain-containing protein [Soonwooa sp.]|uniref:VapE domain-containing protein n=1 Tax=Soonwooa sp. TaxID=1938592 RepID=UPI0028ADB364|nr:VapE domain-containing protein [Soonwooa sp.]